MFSLFKRKRFEPNFPLVELYSTEAQAREILEVFAPVREEDPETDRTIAQKVLVAENDETRIHIGIWDGRVRFTNYLTQQFDETDKLRNKKLFWFIDRYGGFSEFGQPMDTGYMLFFRNETRKLTLVYGLHMAPIRLIDQDPAHFPESGSSDDA